VRLRCRLTMPEHAAREHELRAALSGATTMAAFQQAQLRQLTARTITLRREEELVRGAQVSNTFAALFSEQRLEAFKLEQAESAARFALRHNGQLPRDRLQGPTRALEAIITALVVERDRLERENNI
jgi:hypothetical protein